jgi:hypothetical protein
MLNDETSVGAREGAGEGSIARLAVEAGLTARLAADVAGGNRVAVEVGALEEGMTTVAWGSGVFEGADVRTAGTIPGESGVAVGVGV